MKLSKPGVKQMKFGELSANNVPWKQLNSDNF